MPCMCFGMMYICCFIFCQGKGRSSRYRIRDAIREGEGNSRIHNPKIEIHHTVTRNELTRTCRPGESTEAIKSANITCGRRKPKRATVRNSEHWECRGPSRKLGG
ncbi:uncharacterized protein EI90DRAFT_3059107 [Cantharellus anzutake]|uniref:uncharacterized protein n=1 Tax=Cantharellus anzutake TaxID=1750568 RepID=UPI001903408C|nr:uncharacterized protein EI90DRAFT_3059107 [Cantharellus anzutake]KAF8330737.1 hypothetical protein EI90DRAFT_3059107 [Cantharellus anzutake]